jgi:hypothetical protein
MIIMDIYELSLPSHRSMHAYMQRNEVRPLPFKLKSTFIAPPSPVHRIKGYLINSFCQLRHACRVAVRTMAFSVACKLGLEHQCLKTHMGDRTSFINQT